MTEKIAETRTMPAETSLAILASCLFSKVIRSTIASMAVLTISETMTILKVKISTSHSKVFMDKYFPSKLAKIMANR